MTKNTLCGTFTGTVAQCSTVTIPCAATLTDATVITVQLYTNGRNVHLMFEDLTVSTTALTAAATGNYTIKSKKVIVLVESRNIHTAKINFFTLSFSHLFICVL